MNEILLYGGINNWSASDFITTLNSLQGSDITCRVNCYGGDVFSGWGMIAKMDEYQGEITLKVDGMAASMAAFMLLFAKNVECLDASTFLFHRADGYVSSEEDKKWLSGINANFRKKMEAKIPSELFAQVTGKTYDEMFDSETRIDINLDAKQAKKLGLVSKINTITPAEAVKVRAAFEVLAQKQPDAKLPEVFVVAPTAAAPIVSSKPNIKMNIAELKAAHPELVAQIEEAAIKAERDRVGSFMAFLKVDAEAVTKGIASGDSMSQTQLSEFSLKAIQANTLAGLPNAAAPATQEAPAGEASEEEKARAAFLASAREKAGIKETGKTDTAINFG